MSEDHVETLKRWVDDLHRRSIPGPVADAIHAVLEENEHPKDRGEDCDLCGEILGDAACEKCVGKLEACIDAALALKMPQPTHEDDDERAVYEHGWDDCMGATVKALRRDQPEEVKP